MTPNTGGAIQFTVNREVVRDFYHDNGILLTHQFDVVDWHHVNCMLNEEVPKLFQLWACKQVMGVAAMNVQLHYRDSLHSKVCP